MRLECGRQLHAVGVWELLPPPSPPYLPPTSFSYRPLPLPLLSHLGNVDGRALGPALTHDEGAAWRGEREGRGDVRERGGEKGREERVTVTTVPGAKSQVARRRAGMTKGAG